MAILPLRGFGCKMPIRANFGEVFWGFDPLNVVRYCRDPQKAHPWPETCVLTYRSSRSVKKCDLCAWRRKQKKKERKEERKKERKKETPRFDKSRICPYHPRRAIPTKVVIWCGVPDMVNHAKFHQNRFRGFGSLRGRNLPFSYA